MKDLKQVIEEINRVQNADPFDAEATTDVLTDALALLKEQDATINQLNGYVNEFGKDVVPIVRCKDCKHYDQGDERHICNPGTGSCIIQSVYCYDNWFCAGGERR